MKFTKIVLFAGLILPSLNVCAATLKATYQFNNTLLAQESTAPALTETNPLGLNAFEDAVVFNRPLRVFHWDGDTTPNLQAGLSLDTRGLIPANSYSVEMAFEFSDISTNGWRRIIDVQDRTSDDGFYVDSSDHLNIFPEQGGAALVPFNTFHHIVLTVNTAGTVQAYLDGKQQLNLATTQMNLNTPHRIMNFFLDNTLSGGQGEFSDGRIAWLRIYKGDLKAPQVKQLYTSGVSVSGSAIDLGAYNVSCNNLTSGKTVSIKTRSKFDCEQQGLAVKPADNVTLIAQGSKADATKTVKGTILGFSKFNLQCDNLTTGAAITVPDVKSSWDCESAGLSVTVGDTVKVTVQGNAH